LVLVMRVSLGEWYTIGFISPYDGAPGKFTVLKEQRNPGDVAITSRFGNSVKVLAGGLTDVRASALTGTAYLPDEELIHNTCKNYVVDTMAGSLNWRVDPNNKTGSAVFAVNASLEEGSPQAILSLGHNTSGNLFEASTSRAPSSRFAINRQGVVRVDSAKDINLQAQKGNLRANGRMIYLNSSGSSGVPNPVKFPGNAVQLTKVLPSMPTPAINFPSFKGIPTSLPTPDVKRLLKPPTLKLPTNPLPKVPSVPKVPSLP